jgi:hypothetical protein
MTAGFEASVPFPQIITPPNPAASAVRKMAPRFPGFSIPSKRKIGEFGRGLKSANDSARNRATATIPSFRFPKAIFEKGRLLSGVTAAP